MEVQGWRVTQVTVSFAPDAALELPNVVTNYVNRELQKTNPGLNSLPVDPANPDRNVYAEKATEIAAAPGAQAEVRARVADLVRPRFQQAFANTPSGSKPIHLNVIVKQIAEFGDSASFRATAEFVDPATGRVLLTHPEDGAVRTSRSAAVVGAAIGGGLLAAVVVGAVGAAMDHGRPPPLTDVMDQTAVKMRTWLLKSEGE